jgi:hypothetical protein
MASPQYAYVPGTGIVPGGDGSSSVFQSTYPNAVGTFWGGGTADAFSGVPGATGSQGQFFLNTPAGSAPPIGAANYPGLFTNGQYTGPMTQAVSTLPGYSGQIYDQNGQIISVPTDAAVSWLPSNALPSPQPLEQSGGGPLSLLMQGFGPTSNIGKFALASAGLFGAGDALAGGLGVGGADVIGSDWSAGLGSAMNPGLSVTGGGMNGAVGLSGPAAGSDIVGSDWSTGLDSAMNPGLNSPALLQRLLGVLGSGTGGMPNASNLMLQMMGINPSTSPLGSLFNVGSGLYGLYQANQLKNIASQAAGMQDPFGPQRGQYQAQLSNLMANPGSVTSLPGYQFQLQQGQQALERSMAGQGYGPGSGNLGTALVQYGQNYAQNVYQQQLQNLIQLAGGNINPSGAGQTLLAGNMGGINLAGQTLGRLGYGGLNLLNWMTS